MIFSRNTRFNWFAHISAIVVIFYLKPNTFLLSQANIVVTCSSMFEPMLMWNMYMKNMCVIASIRTIEKCLYYNHKRICGQFVKVFLCCWLSSKNRCNLNRLSNEEKSHAINRKRTLEMAKENTDLSWPKAIMIGFRNGHAQVDFLRKKNKSKRTQYIAAKGSNWKLWTDRITFSHATTERC